MSGDSGLNETVVFYSKKMTQQTNCLATQGNSISI